MVDPVFSLGIVPPAYKGTGMGMILFHCKACGEIIRMDEKFIGRRGRCPQCQTMFAVPEVSESVAVVKNSALLPPLPVSTPSPTLPLEHASPKEKQPAWVNVVAAIILLLILGLIIYGITKAAVWGVKAVGNTASNLINDSDTVASAAAEEIVKSQLIAPSTAVFGETVQIDHSGKFYLEHVVVDSQNSFSAMIRGNYLVALSVDGGGRYSYNRPEVATLKCSDPPSQDEIYIVEVLNSWPGTGALKQHVIANKSNGN